MAGLGQRTKTRSVAGLGQRIPAFLEILAKAEKSCKVHRFAAGFSFQIFRFFRFFRFFRSIFSTVLELSDF